MQIIWPNPQEYNEAVQNPRLAFTDPELQQGNPELNQLGLPRPTTGSFATVYRLMCSQKSRAVRCFLRSAYDQELRYARISQHIKDAKLTCTVGFEYQPEGIKFRGRRLPILKMEWVDGVTLDNFIKTVYNNSEIMLALAERFFNVYRELQQAGIAHGDLQHGNLIVSGNDLRLIDYDGMYVPALAGKAATEIGHRNYQHPFRSNQDFGPNLDNFSAWVIFISLYALSIDGSLWQTLVGGEECLLFRQSDFRTPLSSQAFSLLTSHGSAEISNLALFLRNLCREPIEHIPPLTRQALSPLPDVSQCDLSGHVKLAKEQLLQDSIRKPIIVQNVVVTISDNLTETNQTLGTNWSHMVQAAANAFRDENYVEATKLYQRLLNGPHHLEATKLYQQVLNGQKNNQITQIEYLMQLGYCNINLGNFTEALPCFVNALALSKSGIFIMAAQPCALCSAIIYCAQGNTISAINEIDRNFHSNSDLTATISRELKGPLAKNILLANFLVVLAENREYSRNTLASRLYDLAIEGYVQSMGRKSIPTALCLHKRALCNLGIQTLVERGSKDMLSKVSDVEQDLKEALSTIAEVEGASSRQLPPIRSDLVRLHVQAAGLYLRLGDNNNSPNYYFKAETFLKEVFTELTEVDHANLLDSEYTELLTLTLEVYAKNQNDNLLVNAFNTFTQLQGTEGKEVMRLKELI